MIPSQGNVQSISRSATETQEAGYLAKNFLSSFGCRFPASDLQPLHVTLAEPQKFLGQSLTQAPKMLWMCLSALVYEYMYAEVLGISEIP